MLYDVLVRTMASDGTTGWATDTTTRNRHYAIRRLEEVNRKAIAVLVDMHDRTVRRISA
jgi:hypothetical protein